MRDDIRFLSTVSYSATVVCVLLAAGIPALATGGEHAHYRAAARCKRYATGQAHPTLNDPCRMRVGKTPWHQAPNQVSCAKYHSPVRTDSQSVKVMALRRGGCGKLPPRRLRRGIVYEKPTFTGRIELAEAAGASRTWPVLCGCVLSMMG